MQKITKVQKDYLEQRLREIKGEKMRAWSEANPEPEHNNDYKEIYKGIKNGTVKLKPWKESMSYHYNTSIFDWFDTDTKQAHKKWKDSRDAYENTLLKFQTNLMDKVILSSLDIDAAIKEFKSL